MASQKQNHQIKKEKSMNIFDSSQMNELEPIEEIAVTNNAKVYKVYKKKICVLKFMNTNNLKHENFQRLICEFEIMNMLDHPNILKVYGIFLGDEKTPPSILLEYCPENLEQAIKKKSLTKVQIVCIIYQIAEGMKYIHFRKIIHRDLKPTNILIAKDGTIKIADFGISKLLNPDEQTMTIGTETSKFMAPEVIREDNYNEKADVYSFGVLVFFLLTGGKMPDIKLGDILDGKIADIPESFQLLSHQLIESCWISEPDERTSFSIICQQLEINEFKLLDLTKAEIHEIQLFVNNMKEKIPIY